MDKEIEVCKKFKSKVIKGVGSRFKHTTVFILKPIFFIAKHHCLFVLLSLTLLTYETTVIS